MPKGARNRVRERFAGITKRPTKLSKIKRGYTYRWEQYRISFLGRNPLCVRCLATGRTTVAKHVDHIIPVDSASDEPFWPASNHQALCASCHGKKTMHEDIGKGRAKTRTTDRQWSATLVCGPPCAGKNTYVENRITLGDLIIDVDALHHAVSGMPSHDHSNQLLTFAFTARDAIIDKLLTSTFGGHVWIVTTAPTRADRIAWTSRLDASVVLLVPDKAECLKRATTERPEKWLGYVRQWYQAFEQDSQDLPEPEAHTSRLTDAQADAITPSRNPSETRHGDAQDD